MKKHERKHLRVNFIDMFWLSANVAGAAAADAATAATAAAAASRFTHTHTVRAHTNATCLVHRKRYCHDKHTGFMF